MRLIVFFLLFFVGLTNQRCGNKLLHRTQEDELMTDWIKLSLINKEQVVYNSCEMGNLILTVEEINNRASLRMHGEQEDSYFQIQSSMQVGDTIQLQMQVTNTKIKQSFWFNWVDKTRGVGRWRTEYRTGHKLDLSFVNKKYLNSFKIVNQPCRECWGDECDD